MLVTSRDASLELRLIDSEPAGRDTRILRLRRADGGPLPGAEAGSHITLQLPVSGTLCLERQYSILRPDAAPDEYVLAVKKDAAGRGGSAFIHDALRVGAVLVARGPYNNFPLVENARYTILIGGGIGVTPLIAMATRLSQLGRSFELHVAFRDADHAILSNELRRLPNVSQHLDAVAGALFPLGETLASAPRDAHLYCCGPTSMLNAFLERAAEDARDPRFLHVEYFHPAAEPALAGSFTVELARSGRVLTVPPGKSILQVLRDAGISALSNCEQGTCGACEVKVLAGVPDHRDAVLTPSERKQGKAMMICCSGALTDRLVLDL